MKVRFHNHKINTVLLKGCLAWLCSQKASVAAVCGACSNCQLSPFHLCLSSFWSFNAMSLSGLHPWHEHWPERAVFRGANVSRSVSWCDCLRSKALSRSPCSLQQPYLRLDVKSFQKPCPPILSAGPSLQCFGPSSRSQHACPSRWAWSCSSSLTRTLSGEGTDWPQMQLFPRQCDPPAPRRHWEDQLLSTVFASSISSKWQFPLAVHAGSEEERERGFKERGGLVWERTAGFC